MNDLARIAAGGGKRSRVPLRAGIVSAGEVGVYDCTRHTDVTYHYTAVAISDASSERMTDLLKWTKDATEKRTVQYDHAPRWLTWLGEN